MKHFSNSLSFLCLEDVKITFQVSLISKVSGNPDDGVDFIPVSCFLAQETKKRKMYNIVKSKIVTN